jgi:hypothetical protein
MNLRPLIWITCGLTALALAACGNAETSEPSDPSPDAGAAAAADPESEPGAVAATDPDTEVSAGTGAETAEMEIDPDALSNSGAIEIKQYSAAYIGSGTLGKGTLTYQGRRYPFRIGGLGIGGIGVAAIDAHGSVYDLPDLGSFAGTYGNARLGATAADKGKGRLWLKNTRGVVLKLETKMQGLALTGGVDGIVITFDENVQKAVQDVKDGSQEAWSDVKEGSSGAWKSAKDALR